MANSEMLLVCKHCGENILIGKGYNGEYFTRLTQEQLQQFFKKHAKGLCSEGIDCSDDARNHFKIDEFNKGE